MSVRNTTGQSPYFRGYYKQYGVHCWNVKIHDAESEYEFEAIRNHYLGGWINCSFESINDLLGRKVKASLEGRSGGWLTIHEELTEEELKKIDVYVMECMEDVPSFLAEEREYLKELECENE